MTDDWLQKKGILHVNIFLTLTIIIHYISNIYNSYFRSNLLQQLYLYMFLLCMYFLFALFLRATAGNGDINASNKIHVNICCQYGVLFLGFLMLYYSYHTDYTK